MKAGSCHRSCARTSRLVSLCAITVLTGLMLLPTSAEAQASLAGVARDSSGAVLPGVTSLQPTMSPALLIALAWLWCPPSVPRSTGAADSSGQATACYPVGAIHK